MFERFTERARQVVVLAQEEARTLKLNYIGTEHLLLGLLRDEEGEGYAVLQELGVDVEELRELTLTLIATRPERRTLPYAPDLAGALSRATEAAREGGDEQVELRHLRQVLERT